MELNQVTLPVQDMSQAVQFYLTLGFTQIVDTPHYARFICPDGDTTFSLSLEDAGITNPTVIYFEHEALDELYEELLEKGTFLSNRPQSNVICGKRPFCTILLATKLSCIGPVTIG